MNTAAKEALKALQCGDIVLAPNHTYECGSSHSAGCTCGAVEKTAPLIKEIYAALTTPRPVAGEVEAACVWLKDFTAKKWSFMCPKDVEAINTLITAAQHGRRDGEG